MTQKPLSHVDMVNLLCKPGALVKSELTAENAHLLHMAVGIAGEAGELLDAIKKAAIYNKPIDLENVIEELGDLEFYMQGMRFALGINRSDTIEYNIEKLSKRYNSGSYSNQQAQDRADKVSEGQSCGMVVDSTGDCESCQ